MVCRSSSTAVTMHLISSSGDLIYIYVFGNPILVLNTAKAASDLLEKRGSNYSSRPIRTMVVELYGVYVFYKYGYLIFSKNRLGLAFFLHGLWREMEGSVVFKSRLLRTEICYIIAPSEYVSYILQTQ